MVISETEARLRADIERLQTELDAARQAVGEVKAAMEKEATAAKNPLAGFTVGIDVQQVVQLSDQYTRFTAQLKLATGSQREYAIAYTDVKRISSEAQQDLQSTAMLYAGIASGTRELGVNQQQVAVITETVNLSLQVSGATAEASAAAHEQLSQAFATGALSADAFNAVNASAPRLMTALADGIGVPVSALQQMAEEGKITAGVMAEALPGALAILRGEAEGMQTVGGAITNLKNEMMEFVGSQAQASGVVSVLIGGINLLTSNIGLLLGATAAVGSARFVGSLAAWTSETYRNVAADQAARVAKLAKANADVTATAAASAHANARVNELRAAVLAAQGNTQLALVTNGLIPAQARAAAAAEAHTVALGVQAAAARAASIAANLARGALALVGGPIGAIVAVLGLAVTAWGAWGSKSEEANRKAQASSEESTEDMIARLDKQIEKMKERNRLAEAEPRIKSLGDMSDADRDGLARAKAALDAAKSGTGEWAGKSQQSRQQAEVKLQKDYETALKRISALQDQTKASANRLREQNLAEWFGQNGTNAQRLQYRLAELRKQFGTLPLEMEKAVKAQFAEQPKLKADQGPTPYSNLNDAAREKIKANKQEIEASKGLSEVEKLRGKLQDEIAAKKLTMGSVQKAAIEKTLAEVDASEKLVKAHREQKASQDWIKQSEAAGTASTDALATEYAMYGKSAEAREMAMVAIKAEADMQKYLADKRKEGIEIGKELEAGMKAEKERRVELEQATLGQNKALAFAAQLAAENKKAALDAIGDPREREKAQLKNDADMWKERIALAGEGTEAQKTLQSEYDTWYANRLRTVDANIGIANAKETLDVFTALDDAAKSAAQGMADSFGRVGSAIGGLTTALSGYGKTQAAIAAKLAEETSKAGGDPKKLAAAQSQAARDTSSAQLKSYRDMASAAKGFFDENSRGYKAMEAVEKGYRAYEMAMAIQSMAEKSGLLAAFTGLFVTSKATETAAEGTATAASSAMAGTQASAWGVTAVVKAIASLPFPVNLAAGAATLAAVVALGAKMFGGVGGSSVSVSEQRQKTQGTGTVLGDAGAKSESIANSLELAAANSDIELRYTAGMLRSLRNIESSLSGLGNILYQGGFSTDAMATQVAGGWFGKIGNSIFGGKVTEQDNGLTANRISVAAVLGGATMSASRYSDVKKDGGWFHSDKYSTNLTRLAPEANQQFTAIVLNMAKAVGEAGSLLGLEGSAFNARLASFVVDVGKISLKGLDAEGVQKELEAVFSKMGDDMARWSVDGLSKFQQVGEGYLETLVRVATNYANLDSVLRSIHMTFGATGMASIEARENLIFLAGGIDELASKTASFADNFLTEAERLAPVKEYVAEQLGAMGLAALNSRQAFKDYVLGLKLNIDTQREQYVALMDLQEAFAKVYPEIEDTTVSLADAKSALAEAYDAETEAIGATIDRMGSFASSLRKLRDSAVLGNLSPLSPQQKYAEAKAQYESVLAAARGGDQDAQSAYQGAFQTFLEASRTVFASSAAYQRDFDYAQAATEEAARWAEAQVDVGQAQLEALKSQVSGLLEVNKSVLSVRDAIVQLNDIMGKDKAPLTAVAPPANTPIPYGSYGTSNTEALVAEVKSLRVEVAGLRADQQQQTGDVIRGNAAASRDSAEVMARIAGSAISKNKFEERVAPE